MQDEKIVQESAFLLQRSEDGFSVPRMFDLYALRCDRILNRIDDARNIVGSDGIGEYVSSSKSYFDEFIGRHTVLALQIGIECFVCPDPNSPGLGRIF